MAGRFKTRVDEWGRECVGCRHYKTWDEYFRHRTRNTGHHARCKECQGADATRYRRECARALALKARRRYHENRELMHARCKQSYAAHREKRLVYNHQRDAAYRQRAIPIVTEIVVAEVARVWTAAYDPVTPDEILGRTRTPNVIWPRHVTYYLLRHMLRLTCAEVGVLVGRDHSTVSHGIARVTRARDLARETPTPERRRWLETLRRAEASIRERRATETRLPKGCRGWAGRHGTARPQAVGRPVAAESVAADPLSTYWRKRRRSLEPLAFRREVAS